MQHVPGEQPPAAERRLVTVLFADLVNFTGFSEERDPELVRELLTDYFQEAREIVGRFGGSVDKFIGDAVMAVWGARQTGEDDAERAVRAALELVDAVAKLGADRELPALALRAGVLTGEAAVGPGGNEQGLVVGDLVNTASRLQSVAEAGTVLVGESTYRMVNQAIAFDEMGERRVRGKSMPVRAWQALRVVARLGGEGRSERLEAPFVGRAEELRLLKDLLAAVGRDQHARLLSIVGIVGIGKSRLVEELKNYADGLVEDVYWHEGRSPAYDQGVAFWALGEMVRRRAGIAETEDTGPATAKLADTLRRFVPDEAERQWMEPRLAHLLGLAEAPAGQREELFAAWRRFLERVAYRGTTVLIFEDLHWADQGLLDFVEELPDRSRDKPILVVTLARPELLDRRPGWGAGRRHFMSIHLGPLPDDDMVELVNGLVPGLPDADARRILERAAGVPLYAVELVRMLLADGQLEEVEGRYQLVEEPGTLPVPDSLQAVIGARLDRLDATTRTVLQEAAVLGQSFRAEALSAMSGNEQASDLLSDLSKRDLLTFDSDPSSPERGQYVFVQSLIREVAYGRLGRDERRRLHLAAARYFQSLDDDELAGVVAGHYLAAHRAVPEDSRELADRALAAFTAAADRAAALHSHEQAMAFAEQALAVASSPDRRAELWERAARSALSLARPEEAESSARQAITGYREAGDTVGRARALRFLATVLLSGGHAPEAVEILEEALAGHDDLQAEPAFVEVAVELARAHLLSGDSQRAAEAADRALVAAESLELTPLVAEALITKGTAMGDLGRIHEGVAIVKGALELAQRDDVPAYTELRARVNVPYLLATDDPAQATHVMQVGLELARRIGERQWEMFFSYNLDGYLSWQARWEEAAAVVGHLNQEDLPRRDQVMLAVQEAHRSATRGDLEGALRMVEDLEPDFRKETDVQAQRGIDSMRAWVTFLRGGTDQALQLAVDRIRQDPMGHVEPFVPAMAAALWTGDAQVLSEILDLAGRVVRRGRYPRAMKTTLSAALQAARGEDATEAFGQAIELWEELGLPLELGLTLAAWGRLLPEHPEAPAILARARSVWEEHGAHGLVTLLER
ncbi:MAG: adenylate/guanylate cyclase domain-containing protein [Acidimicrobiia bacterium]